MAVISGGPSAKPNRGSKASKLGRLKKYMIRGETGSPMSKLQYAGRLEESFHINIKGEKKEAPAI